MIKDKRSNGRTITHGLPPNRVLAHGHSPFLILSEGPEEDDDVVDETKQNAHTRKKRYVEISVDRNTYPNHILPRFGSEKEVDVGKNTSETQLRREGQEIGGSLKFLIGGTAGKGVSSTIVTEERVESLMKEENGVLPYPRFIRIP